MTLCRHFGICGGCSLQDLSDAEYRALKRQIVMDALARHTVDANVDEVVQVPPASRRRATLKATKRSGGVKLGFHAARSHDVVDLFECLVLTPTLAVLLPGLRAMLADMLAHGEDAEVRLSDTDGGIDLGLRWRRPNDSATLTALARWAGSLKIARISAHGETVVSLARPFVRLGKADVFLPPEVFLQPTREGEAALQRLVCQALSGAKRVTDLFSGCGTFSLPLAERGQVHAVEMETAMLAALAAAVKATPGLKPLSTEKRNLFKRPLTALELNGYDAVCLDPPRAGALEQARMLAASKLPRIAYVSCDAESFARDARVLVDGGFALKSIVPVDQFLWSSHIELMGEFVR